MEVLDKENMFVLLARRGQMLSMKFSDESRATRHHHRLRLSIFVLGIAQHNLLNTIFFSIFLSPSVGLSHRPTVYVR